MSMTTESEMSLQRDGEETSEQTENPEVPSGMSSLKAACEKTWAEIKETHQHLRQCQQPLSAAQVPNQQPLVAILQEKERHLKAEILVTKESATFTLPHDAQVVSAALDEHLKRKAVQLKEIRSLVTAQVQELQASIEKEQQFQQQLAAVHDKLQEKCRMLEVQEPAGNALETVAQELESKINAAQNTERTIMKKMAEFVGKHFPVPDEAQVSRSSRDLRSRRHQTNTETVALRDILLELMTKCVESPNDPYVTLDERHWPAYIELLLRCNIILKHPDDDRRVKLVPFHL